MSVIHRFDPKLKSVQKKAIRYGRGVVVIKWEREDTEEMITNCLKDSLFKFLICRKQYYFIS